MKPFKSTDRLGDIVIAVPKTAEIFHHYRIDYCCGGDRTLQDALTELQLPEASVLDELNTLAKIIHERGNDWQNMTPLELVNYIVFTHHAFLWTNLPKLSELTTTLLRVHGINHPELKTVHRLIGELKTELEAHLLKEETVQYPAIEAYFEHPSTETLEPALSVIRDLETEHVAAGSLLKLLRDVTQDFTVPADGCGTYRMTYALFEKLELDVFQHIHLENNVLFPQLVTLSLEH
jgi:regulator of cell morphogenesis and NO signaling